MAIVKILSRHSPSYASLIRYILQEGKNETPEVFTQNLRSDTIDGYIKEFILNESFRQRSRSDQVYIFQEVLSFASEDREHLSPEVMRDIAREYMRLRGHDGVMLGSVHRDRDHVHLHWAVSALKFRTGTSFGLSKAALREFKETVQQYHRDKYPQIASSFPEHGKSRDPQRRELRERIKAEIAETVRGLFEQSTSQSEFLSLLRDSGLHHYERNGVATGIEHEGMKLRFSRLVGAERFGSLPLDTSAEQQALQEISAIREARDSRERKREGTIEHFEGPDR